ncbi:MAG TPA: acetate kinase [Candidatus Avidehalobacter gallistercoris]|uniref:Acetate kinase n=1 Tax=Candidatus Avidehalobacter gallistercoris TaxID=2840694 RepID=A0A9D1HJJ8_9FIRM|nr:acetate kinase [Candidatus Avidehalobacter gallistercoris]
MLILVLNSGSSSLKYQLFNTNTERAVAKGVVEKISMPDAFVEHTVYHDMETSLGIEHRKKTDTIERPIQNHNEALTMVTTLLTHPDLGVIHDLSEISAVGHRIVHGGDCFSEAVEITPEILQKLEELSDLAPLHNPPALEGVRACQKEIPGVPNVAVFDTAFHQTMAPEAYMYPLSYEMYEKYNVRRYGFHGTSHRYVCNQVIELLGKPREETRIITCHMGNGISLTAIKGGKVVDTSMGFTPLEGIMMGTRCGTIDPSCVTFLMQKEGWDFTQISDYLNKKCGLLGISGISSDMRDIRKAMGNGHKRSKLAVDMLYHQMIKLIGGYVMLLEGVDAIVFTAGMGENDAEMRKAICKRLAYIGVELDWTINSAEGDFRLISTPESKVKVFVIHTNEELMIARDTREVVLHNNLL